MKINVITVNYNTEPFIKNLVDLLKKETTDIELVITDNSGELDSSQIISADNIAIKIIKNNSKHKSVLDSHRSGLNLCLNNLNFENEYTLIIDPDIVFTENTIRNGLDFMQREGFDVMGVHKFYQHQKPGKDITLPYIWFTIIKTRYFKNFSFKKEHPILIQKIYSRARFDTGDSMYDLVRNYHLRYFLIEKFPKIDQQQKYPFIDIATDDWLDISCEILISHYRGGSSERNEWVHKDDAKSCAKDFIDKSKKFIFDRAYLGRIK